MYFGEGDESFLAGFDESQKFNQIRVPLELIHFLGCPKIFAKKLRIWGEARVITFFTEVLMGASFAV